MKDDNSLFLHLNFLRDKNSDLLYDIAPMQTNYFKNSDLLYDITPMQILWKICCLYSLIELQFS